MKQVNPKQGCYRLFVSLFLLGILAFSALVAYRLITGRSLGLRSLADNTISNISQRGRAILYSPEITSTQIGDFKNIIFLHHSVGYNLIEQGGVRQLFTQAGYDFWDHNYNRYGLRDPQGNPTGFSYNVPDDNTDPDGFQRIFLQRAYSKPTNTLSGLLQHDVIVLKSCYPVSGIRSNQQLRQYKEYYLRMRSVMDRHPDKLFILLTPPPLNPAATNPTEAERARVFAEWMKSSEYLEDHANIFTFDFFDLLAEGDMTAEDFNMLKAEFRDGEDSHPNQVANQTIGPLFVNFIIEAIGVYKDGTD
jgi:hypothetical protein